ncbi:MAG TPA: bifunctional phosphopantothenoylcysteine decarboxylase/phosphopantothenate--cysteine ligase CoaBC [Candidatus Avamphibacillus sp.]|nr:bifunctional phosphopantothenoylcysteine decarboxylase/phosphopantothenate--cysteine ligase CoaBC [Candidatus Avamphibacillus sp.]
MVNKKNVLLGVTGGIAAYKACALTSKLTQQGANVKVVMTDSATKFVSPLTFQALSRNPVYIDTFDEKDPEKIAHIDLADWADLIIVAPATAHIIGRLAGGLADDMLSSLLLATKAPVYIAPAMNVNMYEHPAVIKNMKQLEEWGYHFIEPGAGYLACGWIGKGRMEEPESIIKVIKDHHQDSNLLTGKKVLISAGPTRERLDPVRFFTNRSSGKMGFAFAEAALQFGAEVTLVAGPVQLEVSGEKIKRINVTTADEMYDTMHAEFEKNDIVIKAAAVADYRPKTVYDEKMKKQQNSNQLTIEMERTKDILASLGQRKTNQFLVGFAAETSNVIEYGQKKLKEKMLDAIVVNDVSAEGAGFEQDTNIVTYMNKDLNETSIGLSSKRKIAEKILKLISKDMKDER